MHFLHLTLINRVSLDDVTAAILVFHNNETVATLVYRTNPLGVALSSYSKTFYCSHKLTWLLVTRMKHALKLHSNELLESGGTRKHRPLAILFSPVCVGIIWRK